MSLRCAGSWLSPKGLNISIVKTLETSGSGTPVLTHTVRHTRTHIQENH